MLAVRRTVPMKRIYPATEEENDAFLCVAELMREPLYLEALRSATADTVRSAMLSC